MKCFIFSLVLLFIIINFSFVFSRSYNEKNDYKTPQMILLKEGTFIMGSDSDNTPNAEPVHSVNINSFYMGLYEVTNREYSIFLNTCGNKGEGMDKWIKTEDELEEINKKNSGIISVKNGKFEVKTGYENRPVSFVSWYGAVAYCNWLSDKEYLDKCYGDTGKRGNTDLTKKGYRLPTEAEWEYGARGGTTGNYYWDEKETPGIYCIYEHNSGKNSGEVGKTIPNNFGLYDMLGNVMEWTGDWYGDYRNGNKDNPTGPISGTLKVYRGGSFLQDLNECGVANRFSDLPGSCYSNVGFRVARSK
jgi:formylglycine-generating enzyme required for sulfatase activity